MWTSLTVAVMICLVLTSASAAAVSKPTIQLEYCLWGAQYWCSSPQTAELCGKTEWCSKNDWSRGIIQDFPCTVTQQLIKNTRNLITNSAIKPSSEKDYALLIAKGCVFFKDEKSRLKCKELATKEDVILKLVKLIDSKLSVQAVSIAVGSCKRDTPKEESCPRCADVASITQKYMSKFLSEDAYMKLIEAQCAKLGLGRQLCLIIGKDKFKDFYDGLIKTPAQSLCEGSTKCFDLSTNFQVAQSLPECEACTAVVAEIRQLDRNKDIQTLIKNLVKSVCAKLGEFNKVCDNLAEEGLQYLFELVATEMEPDVICEEIKLCTQPEKKVNQQQPLQQQQSAGFAECTLCELAFEGIDTLIKSNVTEEHLKSVLNDVCSRLPPPYNTACDGFVQQYSSTIITYLVQRLEPKIICTALDFCKNETIVSHIKINPELPIKSEETCQLCKSVVTYLNNLLNSNSSEAEIETLLEKACTILSGDLNEICVGLVKEYGQQIVQVLLSELDPVKICGILKFCPDTLGNAQAAIQMKIQPKIVKMPNDEKCELCKYIVTYLDTVLEKNSSEAEIEAALEEACTILPASMVQQCETLVKEYGPFIVKLLVSEMNPNIVCPFLKFCSTNNQASIQVKSKPKKLMQRNDEQCDFCKYVVNNLKDFLDQSSTVAEIETLADKVCSIFPKAWDPQCQLLVTQYGPVIIELLEAEIRPDTVCKKIGFCQQQKQVNAVSQQIQPRILTKPKDMQCELCKLLATYVDKFLDKNSTEAEIMAALNKTCSVFPESYIQQCVDLVRQYGPQIIQLIKYEIEPDNVCSILKLCTGSKQVSVTKAPVKTGEFCSFCCLVFTEVYTILEENSTEEKIEALLNEICYVLPSNIKNQCLKFVALYLPYIVDLIVNEVPPNGICQKLELCNASLTQAQLKVPTAIQKVKSESECDLCTFVVQYLDSKLGSNATEQEIETALREVCNVFPSSLRPECDDFIAQYTRQLVQLLKNLPPQEVCSKLGLCSSQGKAQLKVPTAIQKVKSESGCDLCTFVVQYLDSKLGSNATEQEIETALREVCNVFPSSLRPECDDFIAQYTRQLVQLLKNLPPQEVCSKLGLCSSQGKAQLKVPTAIQKVKSESGCDLCTFVVQYLDSKLGSNATEQEIETALREVCNVFPSSLRPECDDFIAQYTRQLVQLLKNLPPQEVCSKLGLCSSQGKDSSQSLMFKSEIIAAAPPTIEPHCSLCKFSLYYLQTALSTPDWQNRSKIILYDLCSILQSGQAECRQLVDANFNYLIYFITAFRFPIEFCQLISYCEPALTTGDADCSSCKRLVMLVNTFVQQNKTVDETKELAISTCHSFNPGTVTNQCMTDIQKYTPELFQLVSENNTPTSVCQIEKQCH